MSKKYKYIKKHSNYYEIGDKQKHHCWGSIVFLGCSIHYVCVKCLDLACKMIRILIKKSV